ncbi:MAG: GNAT family N-acetyltransferase [Sinobacteraceae bacterium]|nr:GNAT family N-acetyltransferase [Nevskiaceae bacterium]
MPDADVIVRSPVERSARVALLEGLFDLEPASEISRRWIVRLDLPEEWHIGVIVGPSGCGKSTLARALFGEPPTFSWNPHGSLLDDFPAHMSMREIVELLSSVGFASPPSWRKPYAVLSNGEQFRVAVARTLAERKDLAVIDEYSSVVDRTVAQSCSRALAKTLRRTGRRVVLASCHYDILPWLEPDWVYEPMEDRLTVGRRLRCPSVAIRVSPISPAAWRRFRDHHYLSSDLHRAARCFGAWLDDQLIGFLAILHFPHPADAHIKRIHRVVVLPDYQGLGLGKRLCSLAGALCKALGWRCMLITSHPGLIRALGSASDWRVNRVPTVFGAAMSGYADGTTTGMGRRCNISLRLRASLEYIGESLPIENAQRLWGQTSLNQRRIEFEGSSP